MPEQMSKEDCLKALCNKASETGKLPKRTDFSEAEVARIKSYYGPWPRALEAAGLIASNAEERIAKNRDKHLKAKQKKRKL